MPQFLKERVTRRRFAGLLPFVFAGLRLLRARGAHHADDARKSDRTLAPGRLLVSSQFKRVRANSESARGIEPGDEVYNVKAPKYGARGDGVTDDTASILAAIRDAIASNGCVHFPAGTYLAANLQVKDGSASAVLRFSGDGHGSIVRLKAGMATSVFFIAGIAGVMFDNLCLDGNRANCPRGLSVIRSDVSDTVVRSCRIQSGNEDGIFITPDGIADTTVATRVTIEGNHFLDCGNASYGGYAIAAEQLTNASIVGNVCERMGAGLADIEPFGSGAASDSIVICGNVVRNTLKYLDRSGAIQVYSSNASNPAGTGTCAVNHVIIAENVVSTTGYAGIQVQCSRRAVICGNYVFQAGTHGIWLNGRSGAETKYVHVSGNIIVDASNAGAGAGDGIRLDNAQYCSIGTNSILDTRESRRMNYAVRETGTSTNNFFAEQHQFGAISDTFSIIGTPVAGERAGQLTQNGLIRLRHLGETRYRSDFNRTSSGLHLNAVDDAAGVNQPIYLNTATEIAEKGAVRRPAVTLAFGPTIDIDASMMQYAIVRVIDATAFKIAAPKNAPAAGFEQQLTFEIYNASGAAMGAITWTSGAGGFAMAGALTNPLAGKRRTITFQYNQSADLWVEVSRAAADI